MDLAGRVKACLQQKRFKLPQKSTSVSAHFCNESVYGTLNILCVTGVVRLAYPEETEEDRQFEARRAYTAGPPCTPTASQRPPNP